MLPLARLFAALALRLVANDRVEVLGAGQRVVGWAEAMLAQLGGEALGAAERQAKRRNRPPSPANVLLGMGAVRHLCRDVSRSVSSLIVDS